MGFSLTLGLTDARTWQLPEIKALLVLLVVCLLIFFVFLIHLIGVATSVADHKKSLERAKFLDLSTLSESVRGMMLRMLDEVLRSVEFWSSTGAGDDTGGEEKSAADTESAEEKAFRWELFISHIEGESELYFYVAGVKLPLHTGFLKALTTVTGSL